MGELPPFIILPDMGGRPPFWMTEISLVFIARPLEKAAAYWFQKLVGSPLLALDAMSFWKISGNLTGFAPRKAIGPSTESLRPRLAGALFHMCVPMWTCREREGGIKREGDGAKRGMTISDVYKLGHESCTCDDAMEKIIIMLDSELK